MTIPARYANLLFGGILSLIMVSIVSASVLLINQGWTPDFFARWLKSFLSTWPIAFPTVLVVAPQVRRLVAWLTSPKKIEN
ncbi:DUF2798 domain-containing protein [Ampullimonas aquatilis]|uniref:DUF2798 domain-containing protein n=1 Tax=Ampullimonas aquatilis TaxID=1341549 RepID=UPI003C754258